MLLGEQHLQSPLDLLQVEDMDGDGSGALVGWLRNLRAF